MTALEQRIKEAQDAYYINSQPIMSDMEFDELWDQLKREQPDSELLNEIGDDHSEGFEKADHIMTMGSQNKANTIEDMEEWIHSPIVQKNISEDVLGSFKMDGISIEMVYENGKFVRATTRGDGHRGDDITSNVSKMNGVVKQLKDSFTGPIRGEILLSRENKVLYFDEYANCRNAASGIAKRLDGTGCEHLNVVVYDARRMNGQTFGTQLALMEWLKSEGFETAQYWMTDNITGQEAINMVNSVFSDFDNLKYDIDGIVWKTNVIDESDINEYRPSTQIALKPARTYATTVLKNIEWNVVNGTLTPIAIFEPVNMLGAEISRASLSNVRKMEELEIEIGHTITISRCGMIIPKVVKDETTGKFSAGYEF